MRIPPLKIRIAERNDSVITILPTIVINALLGGFEGKLTTSKYAKLAKCSPDTALRDILPLVQRGILHRNPEGGRSTNYALIDISHGEEESRLLEAYPSGAMTPLQLGQQLDLLAARRSALNGRPTGENVASEPPPEVRRKSIEEYCQETRAKIDALDPVQLRRLLQGLVQEVRFDGSTAVLTGRFPIPTGGGSPPAQNPDPPTGLRPRQANAVVATPSTETPDPVGLRPRYRGAVVATPPMEAHDQVGLRPRYRGAVVSTPAFGCPFEIAVQMPPVVRERFVDAEGHYCRASAAVKTVRYTLPRPARRLPYLPRRTAA
jgi:hypothetical protein